MNLSHDHKTVLLSAVSKAVIHWLNLLFIDHAVFIALAVGLPVRAFSGSSLGT